MEQQRVFTNGYVSTLLDAVSKGDLEAYSDLDHFSYDESQYLIVEDLIKPQNLLSQMMNAETDGEALECFLNKKQYTIDDDAMQLVLDILDHYRVLPDFSNARTLRNILDQIIMNQNLRTEDSKDDRNIVLEDVTDYLNDEGIDLKKDPKKHRIGFC